MKKKTISCIIATHKRDKFLKQSIESVLKQTHPPLEIIISDNIPSKKTKKLVKKIAKKNSLPIKYIGHILGGKGCISRNLAVSESKGDYISFLDDDDIWDLNYLKKINSLIHKKKSSIIYSWLIDWHKNEKKLGKKIKIGLNIKDFLIKNPGSVISNLVVKKDIFISLGGFDEYIHPSYDKDFIIRAIYFGHKYDVLKDGLVYMRRDNHGRESEFSKNFLIGMKKFYKKHHFHYNIYLKIKFWMKYWIIYFKLIINNYNDNQLHM